jgi:PAS domain S-box-containing protein
MGARLRAFDWARTPLGDPADWPPWLRAAVSILLASGVPAAIGCGPELLLIGNDAFAAAHDAPLLRPAAQVLPALGPHLARAAAGETVEASPGGFRLTPLRDERGAVAAVYLQAEPAARDGKALFDALDDALVVFDRLPGEPRDWRYVATNPAFQALFGRGDLAGRTLRECFPDEDEGWYDIYDEVAARGQSVRFTREAASQSLALEMFVAPFGTGERGEPRLLASMRDVTEFRRTHRALELSEERLRLATEAAEVGFWDVDVVNDTLTWPPRVKTMFGVAPDRPVAMADFYAGLHPEDRDRVAAAYAAAADPATRALYDVQYRTVGLEDGVVRWVGAKGRGVFDEDGRCLRVIGTAIDLTARKAEAARLRASEAALGETKATLDASLEYAPIGFAFVDRKLRYVRVNDTLARINGLTAAQHVGRAIAEIAPITAAAVSDALRRMFATGEPVAPVEIEDPTSGETRFWLTSFFPVFGGAGEVQYVGATVVDITERKRAEAHMRELNESLERRVAQALAEQRLLAEVIERSDIFVQVADPEFNWLAINEAAAAEFARLFGVARPKAGDNMLAALAHLPEQREAVRAVWARALGGEEFVETQAFGETAHDRRHYEMRFRTLRDSAGRASGAYQFVSDVTARLNEQARLAEAEAALRQAQKMDAIGRLTGGVAHDFNNLLQGVAGSFDLIRRKPGDSERVLRWAEAGLQAAERGAKLTSQLLAFSRSQKLEARPLILTDLLRGMRELIERSLGPAIRVIFELDERCGAVLADATQLELAVLNLAINARDAMPGGGALTLSARPRRIAADPELKPGDYVELSVADDGDGMAPDVVARAFEPFFTTKDVGKGTGLGLAQVYAIARQAGGAARIASRPGKGTTVRLILPRAERPVAAAPAPAPASEAPATAATILVVDDDADVRGFLGETLAALGFSVRLAEDGRSGLEAVERATPDLVLLDYAMPGMSGAEVFRLLRQRHPGLPILFASGYADAEAIAAAGAGSATILRKPFRIDQLRAAVSEALARAVA